MQIVYRQFTIYNSDGSVADVLNGTYEALPIDEQQSGWHALRKVNEKEEAEGEIMANVHIIGGATVAELADDLLVRCRAYPIRRREPIARR